MIITAAVVVFLSVIEKTFRGMRDFSWFRGGKRRISYEPKLGLLIDEEEESDSEDEDVCHQGSKMVPGMCLNCFVKVCLSKDFCCLWKTSVLLDSDFLSRVPESFLK